MVQFYQTKKRVSISVACYTLEEVMLAMIDPIFPNLQSALKIKVDSQHTIEKGGSVLYGVLWLAMEGLVILSALPKKRVFDSINFCGKIWSCDPRITYTTESFGQYIHTSNSGLHHYSTDFIQENICIFNFLCCHAFVQLKFSEPYLHISKKRN